VLEHFRTQSYWKKKIKVLSAVEEGSAGQDDGFQFAYCSRNRYVLVTRDMDFNDDKRYPFKFGENAGIILVRATRSEVQRVIRSLVAFLDFALQLPFPKAFIAESKFILSPEGYVMRGRDAQTKEVKSLRTVAGQTKTSEVREYFSY
jgi:predicted nuclease of predicted toxin-antitoxin system